MEGERLQKFISRSGAASRRQAEAMIAAGRVQVNGVPATILGTRVRPDLDEVRIDGVVVVPQPIRWIILNKPAGYLTTRSDPQRRRTVYELLPERVRTLAYVGRLDASTEGLLLFTNDGDHAAGLLHPSRGVEREYLAWLKGDVGDSALRRLTAGVELDDGPAHAARAGVVDRRKGATRVLLVMTEGRKREVRRLCEAVGHRVRSLERVRFGPVRLGDLPRGAWRELTTQEVAELRALSAPR